MTQFREDKLGVFIMEEMFSHTEVFLEKVREFVQAEDELVNPYQGVKVNTSSEGPSYRWVRLVSAAVRRLGLEKLVHKVKRSRWSRLLRKNPAENRNPIVDDYGLRLLNKKLSGEAREVADLIGRPDVLEIWSLD